MIYLDYAAATPVDPKVLKAMLPYFSDNFFNPSAAYLPAAGVREDYEEARHRIAKVIGAQPAEIVFTAGATESINLALGSFPSAAILTTPIEHPAVLASIGGAAERSQYIKVDPAGRVDLDDLKKKITPATELVSVGYANSEIGTVQPLKDIAALIRAEREERREVGNKTPLYFHTDASAAAGWLDLNTARLGIDLMTLNAAKCYGPKGVGALYVRAGIDLKPVVRGGGQERGLRSGTENVPGVIGFAAALELAEKKRKAEAKRVGALRDDLEKFLCHSELVSESNENKNWIPGQARNDDAEGDTTVIINGSRKHRLPNILNVSIPGLDGERAVFALDFAGVMVATGSACAANKGLRSHVLTAIGLDSRTADGSLRISLGRGTTSEEIEKVKPIFKKVLNEQLKF